MLRESTWLLYILEESVMNNVGKNITCFQYSFSSDKIFDVESYFCHHYGPLSFEVINGDADGTRHQCEHEGRDDAGVRDGIFQTGEALAEN